MAITAFLRKLAASSAPEARNLVRANRNYHSAIFTASTNLSRKSTSFVPIFRFSSAVESKKPTSDESLLRVVDTEIKCAVETDDHDRVEQVPNGFPFKLEDVPGHQMVILTREFENEHIKVEVGMPGLVTGEEPEDNIDDADEAGKGNQVSSIPLMVTVTKKSGTSLEFSCTGYPDAISIDNMVIRKSDNSDDDLPYEGPDFQDLDENLQKAFHRYLEIRGVKPATTNFLFEYMLNKDSKEYLGWLKNVKSFIEE